MEFPLILRPCRSRRLAGGVISIHLLAGIAALVPAWSLIFKVVLWALLALSFFEAWRRVPPTLEHLILHADGHLLCRPRGATEDERAEIFPPVAAHPWLTVFRVRTGGGSLPVVIAPDSLDADEHRRLRVWLSGIRNRKPALS